MTRLAQRRLSNYLLDRGFQLRFALSGVALTALAAVLMGAFLWDTARQLSREVEGAVTARSTAAETSKELGHALLSNRLVQHLNDPTFEGQLMQESRRIDARYEAEREAIATQRVVLGRQQRTMAISLGVGFAALSLLIGLAGIVTSHRIVGPLFRLRRLAREVGEGSLLEPSRLREDDEFQELFEEFAQMTRSLRSRQSEELDRLRQVVGALERDEREAAIAELQTLMNGMEERLATRQ